MSVKHYIRVLSTGTVVESKRTPRGTYTARIPQIVQLARDGHHDGQIAELTGVHRESVRRIRRNAGVPAAVGRGQPRKESR